MYIYIYIYVSNLKSPLPMSQNVRCPKVYTQNGHTSWGDFDPKYREICHTIFLAIITTLKKAKSNSQSSVVVNDFSILLGIFFWVCFTKTAFMNPNPRAINVYSRKLCAVKTCLIQGMVPSPSLEIPLEWVDLPLWMLFQKTRQDMSWHVAHFKLVPPPVVVWSFEAQLHCASRASTHCPKHACAVAQENNTQNVYMTYAPWCWNTYLHKWAILEVNARKQIQHRGALGGLHSQSTHRHVVYTCIERLRWCLKIRCRNFVALS